MGKKSIVWTTLLATVGAVVCVYLVYLVAVAPGIELSTIKEENAKQFTEAETKEGKVTKINKEIKPSGENYMTLDLGIDKIKVEYYRGDSVILTDEEGVKRGSRAMTFNLSTIKVGDKVKYKTYNQKEIEDMGLKVNIGEVVEKTVITEILREEN